MLHREHGAMFARIGTLRISRRGLREGATLGRRVASPATTTTDFLAPDILNKCGRAIPAQTDPSEGPCDRLRTAAIVRTFFRQFIPQQPLATGIWPVTLARTS